MGTSHTWGAPDEPGHQPRTGGETPRDWAERHRTYPQGQGGQEQYGQGHRHGNQDDNWVLGAPPGGQQG